MDTRWWILVFCCIHSFCTEFFLEEPSVLVQRLVGTADACVDGTDTCLNLDLYQFNLIFSVNSWASAFAALFTGIIIDRYGSKLALWISAVCVVIGPLLFATATYSWDTATAFAIMLVGRLLMGLGAGSAVVILHRMKAAWFLYRELALAFSIQILLGRLGSATCFLLLGSLVGIIGLRGSLWLGFLLNLFSGACAVALAYLDQRGSAMANTSPTSGNLSVVWRFIKNMDAMYWNLVAVVFFFNGSISTLVANGPNFLAMEYGFSEATASYMIGIIYDVGILAPLSGWLTDRYGYREYWLTGTSIVLFSGILFILVFPNSIPGLFILFIGLSYTAYAPTVWSSIPLIVPPDAVGMATGTGKFFNYVGVGSLTTVAGAILNMKKSTKIVPWEAFFIFLTCTSGACIIFCLAVFYLNRMTDRRFTPSQAERDRRNGLQEITPLCVDYGSGISVSSKKSLAERKLSSKTPNEISDQLSAAEK